MLVPLCPIERPSKPHDPMPKAGMPPAPSGVYSNLNMGRESSPISMSPVRCACIQRLKPSSVREMPPAGLKMWYPYLLRGTGETGLQRAPSCTCGQGSRAGSTSAGSPKMTERIPRGLAMS